MKIMSRIENGNGETEIEHISKSRAAVSMAYETLKHPISLDQKLGF